MGFAPTDEHQAIYGFRGAFNALSTLNVDETHYLTASFRFGDAVADVANLVLAQKGEANEVKGLGAPSQMLESAIKSGQPHAYISRGNGALFRRAVEALNMNEPFALVGGVRGYRFDLITDVHNLRYGQDIRDPFIRSFGSYDDLVEYANSANDKEILSKLMLVDDYKQQIPSLVQKVSNSALPSSDENGLRNDVLVLTTAHKSKGTEFDNVQLASDYKSFIDEETGKLLDIPSLDPLEQEEYNLQYVAATRAQKNLHINESLSELMAVTPALTAKP